MFDTFNEKKKKIIIRGLSAEFAYSWMHCNLNIKIWKIDHNNIWLLHT